jgi:hypothetical protein
VLLEADTVAGLEARPLPIGLGTGVFLVEEVVVPVGLEVPGTGLHAPPLLFLLLVVDDLLGISAPAFPDGESESYRNH